ncbi:hypothetical protein PAMP_003721 [Pampus punctatissimus]
MEVTISDLSSDSFQCVTEANPHANFTWSRTGGLLPQSAVRAEGQTLQFISMTPDLNGEYQCEASNPYGRKHGRLYLHVTSGACTTGWILFGISLFLNVFGAAAAWYFYKSGKYLRKKKSCGQRDLCDNYRSNRMDNSWTAGRLLSLHQCLSLNDSTG